MSVKDKLESPSKPIIIALDGPSASGKGTFGRLLAKRYNLQYLQSSLAYRGLAYLCLLNKIDYDNEAEITPLLQQDIIGETKNIDLATEEIAAITSKISTFSSIRRAITKLLRHYIASNKRVLMEGRDIGTVVAPAADVKIYLTARVEIRAKRRYEELRQRGKECILPEITAMLQQRDRRDSSRIDSPLKPAVDAIIIDSSELTPYEVLSKLLSTIK